jgi:hypothetical protein
MKQTYKIIETPAGLLKATWNKRGLVAFVDQPGGFMKSLT